MMQEEKGLLGRGSGADKKGWALVHRRPWRETDEAQTYNASFPGSPNKVYILLDPSSGHKPRQIEYFCIMLFIFFNLVFTIQKYVMDLFP